jgi:hypothetical protein
VSWSDCCHLCPPPSYLLVLISPIGVDDLLGWCSIPKSLLVQWIRDTKSTKSKVALKQWCMNNHPNPNFGGVFYTLLEFSKGFEPPCNLFIGFPPSLSHFFMTLWYHSGITSWIKHSNTWHIVKISNFNSDWSHAPLGHVCCPSYSGGSDQEDWCLKSAPVK